MGTLEDLGYGDLEAAQQDYTPLTEAAFTTAQVQELAKKDLNFLAPLAMPTVFKFLYPVVFLSIWNLLITTVVKIRDFTQLAIGLPRGFGKTTVVKLFILFCILFTQKKFILIISSTSTLAENILSDVQDMLNEPNIKRVFGDWRLGIEKDTQSVKKFGFRGRNITLAALGAGTSLRGLNIKNERPDVMIFEDIQTRECADSQVQSEALERWMVGTAMKAKSPTGCLFLFIANMYPTKFSILRKLKNNPKWVKFIVGGILADGQSLWEELQPIEQLIAEYESDTAMGHPEIFAAEVLNDEQAAEGTAIDLTKLPEYPYLQDELCIGNFIVIDPAVGKTAGDAVTITYFEIYDTRPVAVEIKEGLYSPGQTIEEALKLCFDHNCFLIVIESNAYQATLKYWFDFICLQRGIVGVEAVEMFSGVNSKIARILTMFRAWLAGEIFVHPNCRVMVYNQAASFNPIKNNNTDGILDCLTYAPRVIEQFGAQVLSRNILSLVNNTDSIDVDQFNSAF